MKTKWDMTLFYTSFDDVQIDKDIKKIERLVGEFEKKYKENKDYLLDESKLFEALTDYEKLEDEIGSNKPLVYFYLLKYLDSSDEKVEAKINKLSSHLNKLFNKLVFFELNLGKIDEEKQSGFLKSKKLEHFQYFLERIFETAKYDLSEKEEKVLNLKYLTSRSLWVRGVEKSLNKNSVEFNGEDLPLAQAANIFSELPTKERRELYGNIAKVFFELRDFAESEMNAVVLDKKIEDELRGYARAYSSAIIDFENDEDEVLNLVNAVKDNYEASHRFYDIKAKLLDLEKLTYADRSAKVGKIDREFSFEQSVDILRSAYAKLGPEFEKILEGSLQSGQIDVYPVKHKASGAFCYGNVNLPTMILLNHADNYDSIRTFAHEMGHAIHTEMSKVQSTIYQDYSTSTAETASILFENFVFEELFETLSKDEKKIALHNKINEEIATVFRQIAFFEFERDMHHQIRENGFLSSEKLARLMNKHMQNYLGPRFELTDLDGYFFVYLSHIRRYFYVYSYAYGGLLSRILYEKYKAGPSYIESIKKFLSAGGSKRPKDIFKEIGIDTKDPKTWEVGMAGIEEDIKRLERLTN